MEGRSNVSEQHAKRSIDQAFRYYHLDKKYYPKVDHCLQQVFGNQTWRQNFLRVYETLYLDQSNRFRELWQCKDIETMFGVNLPLITNLMILLGLPTHQANMKALHFSRKQTKIHRQRVKACFENDLELREYPSVRISQMIWAAYFIRGIVIEVGILQYEYDSVLDKIKIHIPTLPRLELDQVKQSLQTAKFYVQKYFHQLKPYICNSWLLSKQLFALLDDASNIKHFQTLFRIQDGADCLQDILNFVYHLPPDLHDHVDFRQLSEQTSLQHKIKAALLQGTVFKLGCGELL